MVHMALEFWMEPQVQLTSTSTAVCPADQGEPFLLLLRLIQNIEAFSSHKDMAIYVIEVTEFNSEDICDLQGCLEAEKSQKPDQNKNYQNWEQKS